MNEWFSNLVYLRRIGYGGFATVHKTRDSTGKTYAVKVIPKSECAKNNVEREVTAGKLLKHKNVVSFHSYYEDEEQYYLVFDYVSGMYILILN